MMRWLSLAAAVLLAACGGGGGRVTPHGTATCGPPIPGPRPVLDLSYPEPNATGVPVNIGELVFVGFYQGVVGNAVLNVAAASGAAVPVGAFVPAPSPMPTPYAIPPGWSGDIPFVAAPIPTLSPAATYTVTYTFTDDGGPPPACTVQVTATSGAFTTK